MNSLARGLALLVPFGLTFHSAARVTAVSAGLLLVESMIWMFRNTHESFIGSQALSFTGTMR